MPTAIARRRGVQLSRQVINEIIKEPVTLGGCLRAMFIWPIKMTWELLKILSKKILYFLTVKESTDQVSFYWHQAFLIDYMLLVGHLESVETAQIARQAMEKTLAAATTSPLSQLARQVVQGTGHIFRLLRRAKRGKAEDEALQKPKSEMRQHWADFSDYFKDLARRYYEIYQQLEASQRQAEAEARQRQLENADQNR
jgi:hypothetical protein